MHTPASIFQTFPGAFVEEFKNISKFSTTIVNKNNILINNCCTKF